MPETSIVLVRHGHTAHNSGSPDAALVGWSDPPLSNVGRQEASRLAARLSSFRPFSAVYSSSSRRSLETATLALDAATRASVQILDDLREIHCGWLEGRRLREIERAYPALWLRNQRQDEPSFRWPGGESYQEFRGRCLAAIGRMASGGRVLVFTHAGLISQVIGASAASSPACWSDFRAATSSITEITWRDDVGPTLVSFNDARHVAPTSAGQHQ